METAWTLESQWTKLENKKKEGRREKRVGEAKIKEEKDGTLNGRRGPPPAQRNQQQADEKDATGMPHRNATGEMRGCQNS